MSSRSFIAFVLCWLWFIASTGEAAADVLVLEKPPAALGARFAATLGRSLETSVRLVLAAPDDPPNPTSPPDEAVAALDQARQRYRSLDFAAAGEALEEVWRTCVGPGHFARCSPLLFEASVLRGVIELAQGEESTAATAFRTAHAVAPTAVIDPRLFSPKIVSAFARACAAPSGRLLRSLRLHVHPEGAIVQLDGALVSANAEIVAARHVLSARLPGYVSRELVLEVSEGEGLFEHRLELLPAEDAMAWLELRRLLSADVIDLGGPGTASLFERFDVDAVLVLEEGSAKAQTRASLALPGRAGQVGLPALDPAVEVLPIAWLDAVRVALGLPPTSPLTVAVGPAAPDAPDDDDFEGRDDELDDEEERSVVYSPAPAPADRREQWRAVVRSPWLWIGAGLVLAVVGGVVVGVAVGH